MSRRSLYIGRSGQLAVMAEFLYRGYNVAIPEVDVGDDGDQNHDAHLLTRFLALERTHRLDSVERHRQWQASLDHTEFYDQLFHA